MKVTSKRLTVLATAVLCGLAAPGSWAADTVCTIIAYDDVDGLTQGNYGDAGFTSPPATTIAVASNFYGPGQALVEEFLQSTYNAGLSGPYAPVSSIGICHNATGHLVSEIAALTGSTPIGSTVYSAHPTPVDEALPQAISYNYSLFLAANRQAPVDLASSTSPVYTIGGTGGPKVYANGIPVLFTNYLNYRAPQIAQGESSPSTVTSGQFSPYVTLHAANLIASSASVGVANDVAAPYGRRAYELLDAMGLLTYVPGSPPPTPSWLHAPYDNIELTYQAAYTGAVRAAFVSKAQVCGDFNEPTPSSSTHYVQFASSNDIPQWGVLLEMDATPGTNSAEEYAAKALWNYMNVTSPGSSMPGTSQTWNQWLNAQCYDGI